MKKGKEPIKSKIDVDSPANEPSLLTLEPSIKKLLEAEGLGYKFISDVAFRRNYGFNKENWKPHKFSDQVRGIDHEGFLRRGDLILATQPAEDIALKKARLRRKTDAYKHYNKEKANELRTLARESGLDMKIHEGYEENE